MNISKVSVIGLGYIGLPTAAIISNSKIPTCGIDNNKDVVDTVNNGNIHFFLRNVYLSRYLITLVST